MNEALDRYNYYSDPRVTAGKAKPPVVEIENDEGGFDEVALPTRFEVCGLCDGHGSHVNPSLDAGGLRDDFADDPDFMDDYMGGAYDVPCNRCGGMRVVPVVDEDRCDPDLLKAYYDDLQAERDFRAEQLAELRMGA